MAGVLGAWCLVVNVDDGSKTALFDVSGLGPKKEGEISNTVFDVPVQMAFLAIKCVSGIFHSESIFGEGCAPVFEVVLISALILGVPAKRIMSDETI